LSGQELAEFEILVNANTLVILESLRNFTEAPAINRMYRFWGQVGQWQGDVGLVENLRVRQNQVVLDVINHQITVET
jgi:hypothetical protein